ncbi:MAG: cyclase family protein [Clostridia bacterium]|nr:cyclase family protein [Clostridia bacterium]
MLIDITLQATLEMTKCTSDNKSLIGHVGTHFDVMDKEFPLEYTERRGIVFDVSGIRERDIDTLDIDMDRITEGMFVAFYTGYIEQVRYGARGYFSEHPQLSQALITALLDKGVAIIGVDCAGIRRGSEHVPVDRRCADRGAFVVENLCNLKAVLQVGGEITVCTYPMSVAGVTGLPCRVVVKAE